MNNTEINERLDAIEKLLFKVIPWKRLDENERARAKAFAMHEDPVLVDNDRDERLRVVKQQMVKLANMTPGQKRAARFPQCIVPEVGGENKALVPLSVLVNRCAARKAFALGPGETSPGDVVMEAGREAGLVVETLHDLGVMSNNMTRVVLMEDYREQLQFWKKKPAPEAGWNDEEEEEEEEEEPATWGGIDMGDEEKEEETFETSECAQGVATMGAVDEEDDDVVEDEDEDLSTTTDLVDDPWDDTVEVDLHNPIREQFEREAEEAWRREEAALAAGDLVLVDGIPVARKNVKK